MTHSFDSADGFHFESKPPDPSGYLRLRRSVGWAGPTQQVINEALSNALYSISVYRHGELIGCGRIIGDAGLYFYVQDIIVDRQYQGRGLGARIMSHVMGYLESQATPGAFVGLMAAVGVETFYTRYGFERRPDERPGMYLVWPAPTAPVRW